MIRDGIKMIGKAILIILMLVTGTFILYMLNFDNKVIYRAVRPALNKHYDRQARNRQI